MSWFKKICLTAVLGMVVACGFRPLYGGDETRTDVSGQQLIQETSLIFVDQIADYNGKNLYQKLVNELSPKGVPEHPKYRLSVSISTIREYQQGLRMDNLATRSTIQYTATYVLRSYPENTLLIKDETQGQASYNILTSPYATDVSKKNAEKRIMQILAENVALRVATFLKNKKSLPKGKE